MKVTVNRSSVCMGDDIDDHERTYEIADNADCRGLLETLKADGFFASVSGGNVVWVLTAGGDNVFAYYTKTGRISQLIGETSLAAICKKGKLHFNYYSSPLKWKAAIEGYFIISDSSVGRGVWLGECEYCGSL